MQTKFPPCESCRNFLPGPDAAARGTCHIDPPRLYTVTDDRKQVVAMSGWPAVDPGDGCARHPEFLRHVEKARALERSLAMFPVDFKDGHDCSCVRLGMFSGDHVNHIKISGDRHISVNSRCPYCDGTGKVREAVRHQSPPPRLVAADAIDGDAEIEAMIAEEEALEARRAMQQQLSPAGPA